MMHHFAAENMFSVTSDNKVSLAEFIDEQDWLQLQLVVHNKILGFWIFLDLKVKTGHTFSK